MIESFASESNGETPMTSVLRKAIEAKAPSTSPHIVVQARAGSGKTSTLVEGLKKVKGLPTSLVPSPQQAKVWEAMASGPAPKSICFVAFNKSIATELQRRVPQGCEAMTMHSMGLKAVTKAFGRVNIESFRVSNIIAELLEKDIRELRRTQPNVIKATEEIVGLCKQNLTDLSGADWVSELDRLAGHYEVELNGDRPEVYDLVPRVIERCKDVQRDNQIDFNDMIWLPVALNLPVYRYDLLLVDEAQDLNKCQQQLALKAGHRLVLCGDDRQAIYGFAGADAESLPRMTALLKTTPAGCDVLPLTVTRRCGKAIVAEAKRIVSDFEAHESTGEGLISEARYPVRDKQIPEEQLYTSRVKDGDMVLCRVNAPLISQCFRFLKAGRRANIQGRNVGQGLVSTIKKLKPSSVEHLLSRLGDWLDGETKKENAKKNPSDARIIALQDRYECLVVFTEDANTVEEVISKIEKIFTDNKNEPGIRLSSIHRAKGLESARVFFLMPEGAGCPHPMARSAWQRDQEQNLRYVGVTRAIEELIYVT